MTTKTISIDHDTYELLAKEKRGRETVSQIIRRLVAMRPATTAEEIEEAMKPFWGVGVKERAKIRRGLQRGMKNIHAFP